MKIEGLETNPASDLDVVAAPKPPVRHNPYLAIHELPLLLRKLSNYAGDMQTQLGIRLLLLTGVRTGELRLATPDQFDLKRELWIIPPENIKQLQNAMRRHGKNGQAIPPYVVPLPAQALDIVHHLLAQMKPAQTYLLTHRSDLKKRISENTLNSALRRMGYAEQLTGHGIRATISTALNEIGYPKIWIEAQLSHADPNKVSAAYNHAQYVEQRRRMMQEWADRLDRWAANGAGEVNYGVAKISVLENTLKAMQTVGCCPVMAYRFYVSLFCNEQVIPFSTERLHRHIVSG
ncbi:tyrosine-type recombinase/integrase [Brenneria sp. HEZEL_4_2_4]|uniref:tyrosine-type recombinase/integrase n=1 Tax=Brenneria sp. HEZEL_4_2_4 TaxID=3109058 RepID=UPI003FA589F6